MSHTVATYDHTSAPKKGPLSKVFVDFLGFVLPSARARQGRARVEVHGERAVTLADCSEAIRLDPQDPDAYRRRGVVHLREGGYQRESGYLAVRRQRCFQDAIADFTTAIRLNPEDAGTYLWRGTAHKVLGRLERAAEDFSAAIRLNPQGLTAYVERSDVYQRQGETAKAEADRARVTQLASAFN
ncbi:MAG: tetratricopeptide repeat protein [Pirellulales bacterium]|nr:tetratricopeptide repeat protein [Pirellulales bacterium]